MATCRDPIQLIIFSKLSTWLRETLVSPNFWIQKAKKSSHQTLQISISFSCLKETLHLSVFYHLQMCLPRTRTRSPSSLMLLLSTTTSQRWKLWQLKASELGRSECVCLALCEYVWFIQVKLVLKRHVVLQVLDHAIETEKMIKMYETLSSDLLTWIEQTIIFLNNRKLANSLNGVQQQLQAFNSYRTVEKPPK